MGSVKGLENEKRKSQQLVELKYLDGLEKASGLSSFFNMVKLLICFKSFYKGQFPLSFTKLFCCKSLSTSCFQFYTGRKKNEKAFKTIMLSCIVEKGKAFNF